MKATAPEQALPAIRKSADQSFLAYGHFVLRRKLRNQLMRVLCVNDGLAFVT